MKTNETPQTRRGFLTVEQIGDAMRDDPNARTDPRARVLIDLANAHETYTHQLAWLATTINDHVQKNDAEGIPGVYATVLQTSLIPDVTAAATRIETLRRVLETTLRAEDDPSANALDQLIRDHLLR